MATEPGQWIEELFRPAFGLTIDDILRSDAPGDGKGNNDVGNAFDKVAECQVSPLDISAIKNVYQRVWLIDTLEEQRERFDAKGN